MNRSVGIVFLIVGLVLLVYGIDASDSLASSFSEFFSGAPSNKSLALLSIGGILSVVGVVWFFGGGSAK